MAIHDVVPPAIPDVATVRFRRLNKGCGCIQAVAASSARYRRYRHNNGCDLPGFQFQIFPRRVVTAFYRSKCLLMQPCRRDAAVGLSIKV